MKKAFGCDVFYKLIQRFKGSFFQRRDRLLTSDSDVKSRKVDPIPVLSTQQTRNIEPMLF